MSKAKAMILTLGAVGVGAAVVLAGRQSAAATPAKPGAKPPAKPAPAKPAPKPATGTPVVLTTTDWAKLSTAQLKQLTGTAVLKNGSTGDGVRAWQQILRNDGYTLVIVDGDFQTVTDSATRAWQTERGLQADGEVGELTRAKIGTAPIARKPAPAVSPIPQAKPQTAGSAPKIVIPDVKPIPPIPAPGAGPVVIVPSGVPAVPEVQIVPGNATHLAGELALHLITLELALGGPKQAKTKYNKELAKEFQKTVGLVADGEPGPKTFVEMARRITAGTIPLVMFWPKTATKQTVEDYRKQIRAIAAQAPEPVRTALYTAADKETGQGGINGPMPPVGKTPVPAAPAAPVVKGNATDNMPGLSSSPSDRSRT